MKANRFERKADVYSQEPDIFTLSVVKFSFIVLHTFIQCIYSVITLTKLFRLTGNNVFLLELFSVCSLYNNISELSTFCHNSWINDSSGYPKVWLSLEGQQS